MQTATLEKYFLARLERALPNVTKHDGFILKLGQAGYRNFAFGTRFIPMEKDHLSPLFHEISHAIEFGGNSFDERASRHTGFVFHTPFVYLGGVTFAEFSTHQATDRELRTWAIEIALLKSAGVKQSIYALAYDRAEAIKYMSDWCNALYCSSVKRQALKHGIAKKDFYGHQYEEFAIKYYAKKIAKMVTKVDIERCRHEFTLWLDNCLVHMNNQ